jgi:hypothetical protein
MPINYKEQYLKFKDLCATLKVDHAATVKLMQTNHDDTSARCEKYRSELQEVKKVSFTRGEQITRLNIKVEDLTAQFNRAMGYIDRVNEGRSGEITKDQFGTFIEAPIGPKV